jgi:ribosome-associated protein
MMKETYDSYLNLAKSAVTIASDKQATDILLIDISPVGTFADFFVFITVDNSRLMNALIDDLKVSMKNEGAELFHIEGEIESGWVLMDFGSTIVHIFSPETRQYYDIDSLWLTPPAKQIVKVQ